MKTIKIGVSCAPNTYIISHEIIKGKKLLVSYDNSSKTYFCAKVVEMNNPSMLAITLLTGEYFELNPAFVVETKDRDIVKVISDITGHKNYTKKVCSKAIETEHIELLYGENALFVKEYTSRHTGDLQGRVIFREEEIKN